MDKTFMILTVIAAAALIGYATVTVRAYALHDPFPSHHVAMAALASVVGLVVCAAAVAAIVAGYLRGTLWR